MPCQTRSCLPTTARTRVTATRWRAWRRLSKTCCTSAGRCTPWTWTMWNTHCSRPSSYSQVGCFPSLHCISAALCYVGLGMVLTVVCVCCRSTGSRGREADWAGPGLLHPDFAQLHPKQAQRRAQVQHTVCQAAVHLDGAAHLGQPELQHVHLIKVEEPKAAALPRGDLGRDGRGGPSGPRHGCAPLTFPCPPQSRPICI